MTTIEYNHHFKKINKILEAHSPSNPKYLDRYDRTVIDYVEDYLYEHCKTSDFKLGYIVEPNGTGYIAWTLVMTVARRCEIAFMIWTD